jgi:DNA-directed RNA polymerase specialized sigma24 family protein
MGSSEGDVGRRPDRRRAIARLADGRRWSIVAKALLADSVGLALLVVLDTLAPAERLAFVLHDMFAVAFDEMAPIVERSPTAPRQLASRARRRVQGAARVPDADLNPPARSCRRLLRRRPRR